MKPANGSDERKDGGGRVEGDNELREHDGWDEGKEN